MFGYCGYTNGPFGFLITILVWILVISIIVRVLRRRGFHGDAQGFWREKDALDILEERYAKGEIDKKEFEEKKADLIRQK